MKTFPYYTEDEKLMSFEISNLFCSRRRATKIAASIDGVRVLRKPQRRFSLVSEEVFCEIELEGYLIEISEPFGDNSRYLIFSAQSGSDVVLEKLKNAFMGM